MPQSQRYFEETQIRCHQSETRKVKEITLQLPKSLKLRVHKVIREQTRTSGVIVGAVVTGFAISALSWSAPVKSTCQRLRLSWALRECV